MVEANPAQAPRAHLSTPQTTRGFACPLMMTEGNTHIVYATGPNLVFRGRNGAPDFVYNEHNKKITALGHMLGNEYAFGDETGTLVMFTFQPDGRFELGKVRPLLGGPIKQIKFFHESKEMQRKYVVVGDSGPGGVQAVSQRVGNGIDNGPITGMMKGLNCCVNTKAEEQKVKTKVYSGGETGEIYMHEGTPFSGQGQVLEHFHGDYINAMAICNTTNRLFACTSSKKIAVYDTETQTKICQVDNAHAKGIYGCALVPEGNDATLLTCSADNTIKQWKLVDSALTEVSSIP